MRAPLRQNALTALFALPGLAALAWLGLVGFAWSDYDLEAAPAFRALTEGHLQRFAELVPVYGGSLVLRAPFALAPGLWGGGELAVYRMVALPCLLASGALGIWLVAAMRGRGAGRVARGAVLLLCVANPITLRALEIGHPEELLTATLCVAALLTARAGRVSSTAVLLGLAVAAKPWALVAVGPAVVALEQRRLRMLLIAAAVTAAVLAPLALARTGGITHAGVTAAATGPIFQPWQAWWFAGSPGHVVRNFDGIVKPGYRAAPAWIGALTHPLILVLALVLTLVWHRRRGPPRDALLLLAFLLLLRCVLDPWNNVYYSLGFILALLAWESRARPQPLLTLAATVAVWVSFEELPTRVSADAQAAIYLAWVIPLACALALRLYAPRTWARGAAALRRGRDAAAAQLGSPGLSGG